MAVNASERWTLPFDATAPALARRQIADALGDWPGTDDACLVVSELVSNAVEHGAPPIWVQVSNHVRTLAAQSDAVDGELSEVVIEVVSCSTGGAVPTTVTPVDADPRGRGLQIVTACAATWDWSLVGDQLTVRAVISR